MTRALLEVAGGLATGGIVRHMQQGGLRVVAVDASPLSAGLYLADCYYLTPSPQSPGYFDALLEVCRQEAVALVFPVLDEMLEEWARQANRFQAAGARVVLSPPETLAVCIDKWRFFEYFRNRGIPLPRTSLAGDFPLIKPRRGHGGRGVFRTDRPVDMTGRISQEFLEGAEYSADVLCGPDGRILARCVRKRLRTAGGPAVAAETVDHPAIAAVVDRLCAALPFFGPVNAQFIETRDGVSCTEVNPRLGGAMTMSMAASAGNWFAALQAALEGQPIPPPAARSGVLFTRYYEDVAAVPRGAPADCPAGGEQAAADPAPGRRSLAEALESPCFTCPDSPCCRYLSLGDFPLGDVDAVDRARFLLNFERIELGLARGGRWSAHYLAPCRHLEPSDATCRLHDAPDQPSICRHYNPYRCWYRDALVRPDADGYQRVDRARLEFVLARLVFDEQGRIADGPDWAAIREGFRALPPVGLAERAAGPVAEIQPPHPPSPDDATYGFDEIPDPCRDCPAPCCTALLFPYPTPASGAGLDHLKFMLGFPGVELGITDSTWHIVVHTPCRHLREGRCGIYGQPERPRRCAYLDPRTCPDKARFGPWPPADFVRIDHAGFLSFLERFRFDHHGRIVSQPALAELRGPK
jgi:carbamoyl-phosphate synthase large subunit